ncbi:hypothetical protein TRFO_42940 [Tritrichomonas foetus]|uniref:Uncharacterized protein n=1 Tax=Tritrichomonas foetus TaxID=1144522 RepID=A0A1J4KY35_9EUKA|nr:hypothetical protein TRFO_42940 [Tritrichomonas foetus]|eukprot:OHT14612.1 hypothetical protein TRFO_42940 [Tritrichomonas foetus]
MLDREGRPRDFAEHYYLSFSSSWTQYSSMGFEKEVEHFDQADDILVAHKSLAVWRLDPNLLCLMVTNQKEMEWMMKLSYMSDTNVSLQLQSISPFSIISELFVMEADQIKKPHYMQDRQFYRILLQNGHQLKQLKHRHIFQLQRLMRSRHLMQSSEEMQKPCQVQALSQFERESFQLIRLQVLQMLLIFQAFDLSTFPQQREVLQHLGHPEKALCRSRDTFATLNFMTKTSFRVFIQFLTD